MRRVDSQDEKLNVIRRGYIVRDGKVDSVNIVLEEEFRLSKELLLAPDQYRLSEVINPQQISEYGFSLDNKHIDSKQWRYVSARVKTDAGEEWFFVESLKELEDGSHIGYLSRLVMPDKKDNYFHVVDGNATPIATHDDGGRMWDFLSSETGYKSSDKSMKYPDRLRKNSMDRYYKAFEKKNDKMFPKARFGVTGSAGLAMPHFGGYLDKVDIKSSVAFSAGVFFRIPLAGSFSFQPELLYSQLSSEGEIATARPWGVSFTNGALRVPVMFRYNTLASKSDWMFYAEAGLVLDGNFGEYDYFRTNAQTDELESWSYSMPKLAVGFAAGAGVEYYINSRQAGWAGVRYSMVTSSGIHQRREYYGFGAIELVLGFSLFGF